MQDFAGRYGCSHRLLRVRGRDCECGHDRSGQVWFQQFGVRPFPSCVSPFRTTALGYNGSARLRHQLTLAGAFLPKVEPGAVVRGMVAAFDPCKHMVRLRRHGRNDKRAEPPRSARHQLPRHMAAIIASPMRVSRAPRPSAPTPRVRPPAASGVLRQHLRVAKPVALRDLAPRSRGVPDGTCPVVQPLHWPMWLRSPHSAQTPPH
jgi:hypothetical protein